MVFTVWVVNSVIVINVFVSLRVFVIIAESFDIEIVRGR